MHYRMPPFRPNRHSARRRGAAALAWPPRVKLRRTQQLVVQGASNGQADTPRGALLASRGHFFSALRHSRIAQLAAPCFSNRLLLSTAATERAPLPLIKELRARTSAPLNKCVKALQEAEGEPQRRHGQGQHIAQQQLALSLRVDHFGLLVHQAHHSTADVPTRATWFYNPLKSPP
eukprot:3856108-Pleurochrysis_carterae.AAC.4